MPEYGGGKRKKAYGSRFSRLGCLDRPLARISWELHCLSVSEVGMSIGCKLALKVGVSGKIHFHLMNAHKLEFPDDNFDMVYVAQYFITI